jgi:hypothetical protein
VVAELEASVRLEGSTSDEVHDSLRREFPDREVLAGLAPVDIEIVIGSRGDFGWGFTMGEVPPEMARPSRGRSAFEIYLQNLARADLLLLLEGA